MPTYFVSLDLLHCSDPIPNTFFSSEDFMSTALYWYSSSVWKGYAHFLPQSIQIPTITVFTSNPLDLDKSCFKLPWICWNCTVISRRPSYISVNECHTVTTAKNLDHRSTLSLSTYSPLITGQPNSFNTLFPPITDQPTALSCSLPLQTSITVQST